MYVNKCTKCGAEFETKNPKRVICPNCLYPDRQDLSLNSYNNILKQPDDVPEKRDEQPPEQFQQNRHNNYSSGGNQNFNQQQRRPYPQQRDQGGYGGHGGYQGQRPQQGGGFHNQGGFGGQGGGFRRPQQGGGFQGQRPQGGGGFGGQGGFRRPPQGGGGFQGQGGGFRRPPQGGGFGGQGGGFNRRPQGGGGFNRGGPRRTASQKPLLISREQVAEIETLYKSMLPLPNPDCHEVIGQKMELEPNKVFFGINLIRQKMFLPKLPYPKRKLAVSPDQLMAIQNLYAPLLPLPPIGCHKFISKQLKMDEWRVHVGIGIIRKQMNLPRWNPDRDDAPAEFKNQPEKKEKK